MKKTSSKTATGLRHSEMNLMPKTAINWEARQVRIRQGKTGSYKVIGPLGPTSMEILREFYDASKTDLVFSRSGNITARFYQILREACQRAGVPYGRSTQTDWYFTMRGTQPQLIFLKAMSVRRLFKNGWAGLIRHSFSTTHTQQSARVHMRDDHWRDLQVKRWRSQCKILMQDDGGE